MVISLRENINHATNGRPRFFFSERPESLTFMSLRTELVPAIDGDGSLDLPNLLPILRAEATKSLQTLAAAPDTKATKEAMAVFADMPALSAG